MTATLDSVENILKDYYDSTDRVSMLSKASPGLGVVPKRTDFGGSKAPLPFMYAPSGGIGASFPDAQQNKRDVSEEKWEITTHDFFSLFSLDHKAVKMAKGSGKAFVELVESRAEAAEQAAQKMYARYFYGTGGGSLGVIETGGGTANLVLTERAAMHVFDRNMTVTVALTDGGADLVTNDVIGTVNRQTRTLTRLGGGNWSASYATNSHVHLGGSVGNVFRGLAAWLPSAAPSATPFFGVDRSLDSRMYGVIRTINASIDSNIEEALITLLADVNDQGGDPDVILMNTRALRQLVKQLGTSVVRGNVKAQGMDGPIADIGFDSVRVRGESRMVDIVGDRNCPYGLVYALQTDACRLWSAGDMLGWLTYEDDDSHFLRHGQENAMEGRMGGYAQFCIRTPGFCGIADITALLDDEG